MPSGSSGYCFGKQLGSALWLSGGFYFCSVHTVIVVYYDRIPIFFFSVCYGDTGFTVFMRLDQDPPLLRQFKCDLRNGVVLHGKHRLCREEGFIREKIVCLEVNLRGEAQHYGDHDHGKRKADRFLRDFREEDMRMDYDLFDRIGEHSTVGIGTFCVEEMLKTGFRKEQIDLGLAFYARPTDESPYWYDYIDYYDKEDEDAFIDLLTEKSNRDVIFETQRLQRVIRRATERCESLGNLHEKLYEDNARGKVSDDWYMEQAHRYEVERRELKARIASAQEELKRQETMQVGRDNFVSAIRQFMEMQTLTPVLLRELIDRIDVYETEGVGKHRTQRIVIHYRFIDTFALPEARAAETYVADTRQGVAVEYLAQ